MLGKCLEPLKPEAPKKTSSKHDISTGTEMITMAITTSTTTLKGKMSSTTDTSTIINLTTAKPVIESLISISKKRSMSLIFGSPSSKEKLTVDVAPNTEKLDVIPVTEQDQKEQNCTNTKAIFLYTCLFNSILASQSHWFSRCSSWPSIDWLKTFSFERFLLSFVLLLAD